MDIHIEKGSMSPLPGFCNSDGVQQMSARCSHGTKVVAKPTCWQQWFGKFTVIELLLFVGCLISLIAFIIFTIFWLLILDGYKLFINGLPRHPMSHQTFDDTVPEGTDWFGSEYFRLKKNAKICTTANCVRVAAMFLSNMDETKNPCTNFHEFACGNYCYNNELMPDEGFTDTMASIEKRMDTHLKLMLSEEISDNDDVWDRQSKQFYQRCMNESRIESIEPQALIADLEDAGGWPILHGPDWIPWNRSWLDQLAMMGTKYALTRVFIEWTVAVDERNSHRNVIKIDQGELGLQDRYFFLAENNSIALQQYSQLIEDVAVALGADRDIAQVDAKNVTWLEIKLAEIMAPVEMRRQSKRTYNPYQLEELDSLVPGLNLSELIHNIFDEFVDLQPNQTVVIAELEYLQNLSILFETIDKRTIANYLGYRQIQSYFIFMPAHIRRLVYTFHAILGGMEATTPERWKECVKVTRRILPFPVGAMYVRKHFDTKLIQLMEELASGIKRSFVHTLSTRKWMGAETKKEAINKAELLTYKLGHPEWLFNKSRMERDWGKEPIPDNEALVDTVTSKKLQQNTLEYPMIGDKPDRTMWFESPALVDAYYASSWNQMTFPAGIMQYPLLTSEIPRYVNYAMFGAVVGHEVSHAFDDQGRYYDGLGNMRDWWDNDTLEHFNRQTDCFVDLYSSVEVPHTNGRMLNGRKSLGENIADNAGIKTSLQAYKHWHEKYAAFGEAHLPGLEKYSQAQLFFIAYANTWCASIRPSFYRQLISGSVHPPPDFRAFLPLVNVPEFGEAFNCSVGSFMRPKNICTLW